MTEQSESIGDAPTEPTARVPVFHGTRRSLAERIIQEGFGHLSVTEQLQQVASQYSIALGVLKEHLAANGRFVSTDDRAGTVSFAPLRLKAGSWANRAPEATWEALWSVYRIRHPELGHYWNQSNEGHLWVTAQQLDDPPVVITVLARLGELYPGSQDLTFPATATSAWDMLLEMVESGATSEEILDLCESHPEWRARTDAHLEVTDVEEVPVRVDGALACFMSGQSPETFGSQVKDGSWGPEPTEHPMGKVLGGVWFTFDQIWQRLPENRRAELSLIAEVPIDEILLARLDSPPRRERERANSTPDP